MESKDSVLGEVCGVSMNFELAAIMLYIKILPECVILFFFLGADYYLASWLERDLGRQ